MDSKTKASRVNKYKGLNFGGTTDWAIDLEAFSDYEDMTPGIFTDFDSLDGCKWKAKDGFSCSDPASEDTTMKAAERWNKTGAACAWHEFTANWSRVTDQTFSGFAADFFDETESSFHCELIDGCPASVTCRDAKDAKFAGPAGVLILTSFIETNFVRDPHGVERLVNAWY